MFRNKSVDVHQFAMVPRAEIPRSRFIMQTTHKTVIPATSLIPVYVDEVLPGDTFQVKMTAFTRLITPIVPVMDNLWLESFFFFVPCRLVWSNWKKFMGEQVNPGDSISFTVPIATSPVGGYTVGSLQDYMGIPTVGQIAGGNSMTHNNLPFRAYNLIFNEWFRDENLINSATVDLGDGPDTAANYTLRARGKRHDYFTSALPFVQKGTAVSIPLTGNAVVKTQATNNFTGVQNALAFLNSASGGAPTGTSALKAGGAGGTLVESTTGAAGSSNGLYPSNLYADLSTATATTINALRLSFQTQKLLERDARGGTRYTEIVRSHFGVVSPDARLQRPEYLGGGSTPINFTPVPQTSATGLTGGTTPKGDLAAFATSVAHDHGFSQSFTEHGYIIGIVNVRADLTYQQGMRKLFRRSTRYDFYFPVFAALGEQAILNEEIYQDGSANDSLVFGYQERWAEYRYHPAMVTGRFRSTAATTLDVWHLAQKFTALPTLNNTFINDNTINTLQRNTAVATIDQFYFDAFFEKRAARPMPMYSVPGLIDHF